MRKMFCLLALVMLAGCGKKPESFEALTKEFVESTLARSPVAATAAGYHTHAGVRLDERLDDYSKTGMETTRAHWKAWAERLEGAGRGELTVEDRADLEMMQGLAKLAQLEMERVRGWERNPTLYVELLGNGLFGPYSLEYAPKAERYRHIIARLEGTPAFLEDAKANLTRAPGVWSKTAVEENNGNIGLVDKTLREDCPAELRDAYGRAAEKALGAMREFNAFVEKLPDAGAEAWRLGKDLYAAKFALVFGAGLTPEQLLSDAEAELKKVRFRMFQNSLPLHKKYYPAHRDPVDLNLIVGETLDVIAKKHTTPDRYFAEANGMLEEARAFLRAKGERVVALPPRDNLKIIETPAFMRGIYSVGGFNAAPPLEPQLGAYYWLTPIDPKAGKAAESKLREYNDYGLRILTLHEAIPGHYLQLEYASTVEPPARRVLRSLFGDGVNVEGWAVYSNDVMLKEGYLDKNPEMLVTFDKQLLRAIGNAILDIRLQTTEFGAAEAVDFMRKMTFQEEEEARGKLLRAQLSATQLPTYYAGYRAWWRLREAAEKKEGAQFQPGRFHERALKAGALPMASLEKVLGLGAAGVETAK